MARSAAGPPASAAPPPSPRRTGEDLLDQPLVLALVGRSAFRAIWKPLVILIFMIPLPEFFNGSLSLNLQLLSSAIGVAIIR